MKKKEKKQTYALFATLVDLTTEFDDMLKNSEIWWLENLETNFILGHFPKIICHPGAIFAEEKPLMGTSL